jgi:AcrR family transcriptional regulator
MSKGTKNKILEAGLTLFSTKGYLGSTTREIAKKAGVAEVTLFRHFSSKEILFEEIMHTYTFLPTLKDLLPSLAKMDYQEALEEIARRFLEVLDERKGMIQIMYSEIHRYPKTVVSIHRNFVDEIFKTLASYFRKMQSLQKLRGFHPEIGAMAFVGMFFSFFTAREFLWREESGSDKEQVVREFVEIFMKGTIQ